MHLGNARTALLAWLDVRARGGRMILRIDDLDAARSRPEYADLARDDLRWLGLDWDEETEPAAARGDDHRRALDALDSAGLVYECFCSRRELGAAAAPHDTGSERRYPGTCRELDPAQRAAKLAEGRRPALRVRVPDAETVVHDRLLGELRQNVNQTVGDVLIRRSDGLYAYQLAIVVDDDADGVTDVVRGADLWLSTPRQRVLGELLGLPPPATAHVPLLLGGDGRRLAKRERPRSLADLRADGARPEEVVGTLAASVGLVPAKTRVPARELVPRFRLEELA
jgi:glutamyl-tRNA synthetase